MGAQWLWFSAMIAITTASELIEEQYHEMPHLFHLDDYERCLASQRGAFCLGSFDLLPHNNEPLIEIVQKYSGNWYFNHTRIHRGYCVTSRCAHITDSSLQSRFEKCVDNLSSTEYQLKAKLTTLEYCKTGDKPTRRPVDTLDIAFACVVGVIVLCNLAGTAYDLMRKHDSKSNRFLISWSLIASWKRLTADYAHGDPRLTALKPVQGMKANTLILVLLAHSVLAYHITYTYNPQFLEKNGTSIVHTFIMVSSFLLAYNLLLHAGTGPERRLTLAMLPRCLLHRIVRISPVYLFVLGVATTWWSHLADGPMWSPLVERECARCRDKWWTHALYVSNLVRPHLICLVHTWFLAVDMQLYAVSAALTLVAGRRPRLALKLFAGLFLATVVLNFAAIYYWQLVPMVIIMVPERMRQMFPDEPSFKWLYAAPWDSLPAALAGLFVAFLHYNLQQEGWKPEQSLCIRILYRLSVPSMFLWVLGGFWVKGATDRLLVSFYATIDRPVFITLTAVAMFGFFNKIDSVWWQYLSWRGWEVLGRMSLSIYLVHWLHALAQLGARAALAPVSVHDIIGHWLWTLCGSYLAALPLHLFVELPLQKFLQTFV